MIGGQDACGAHEEEEEGSILCGLDPTPYRHWLSDLQQKGTSYGDWILLLTSIGCQIYNLRKSVHM